MKYYEKIQAALQNENLDGWLLYDFRRSNPLACRVLEIPHDRLLTRRFYYWIPAIGNPVGIVSAIESHSLEGLPGERLLYKTWNDLESHLHTLLSNKKKIAMEYSPLGRIPVISKVDAGTIELIRNFGIDVVSSGNLLQTCLAVWNEHKLLSHYRAAKFLDETARETWSWIASCLKQNQNITEYDVQQWMLSLFNEFGFISADPPICAVNEHSADPHYCPDPLNTTPIKLGDFILIDLWCKENHPDSPYADITRVAVADHSPSSKQEKVFSIVYAAQEAAFRFVQENIAKKNLIRGCEVDDVCRHVIEEAGFGSYFIHRTGHNIDVQDHGDGTNIDNYETHDDRFLVPGTCFSIEPGIYLPNEFGIRLEYDVLIHMDGTVEITGGQQTEIVRIKI